MAIQRSVLVVGSLDGVGTLDGIQLVPTRMDRLRESLLRRPPGAVILACGESVEAFQPGALSAVNPGVRVVGVVPFVRPGLARRWFDAPGHELVEPHEWEGRVRSLVSEGMRSQIPDAAWHPPRVTPEGRTLLELVPLLRRFTAVEWAAAAGVSRRTLYSLCERALRMSPRTVLCRYQVAVLRSVALRGGSEKDARVAARFSSVAAMRRLIVALGIANPWGTTRKPAPFRGQRAEGRGQRAEGRGQRAEGDPRRSGTRIAAPSGSPVRRATRPVVWLQPMWRTVCPPVAHMDPALHIVREDCTFPGFTATAIAD